MFFFPILSSALSCCGLEWLSFLLLFFIATLLLQVFSRNCCYQPLRSSPHNNNKSSTIIIHINKMRPVASRNYLSLLLIQCPSKQDCDYLLRPAVWASFLTKLISVAQTLCATRRRTEWSFFFGARFINKNCGARFIMFTDSSSCQIVIVAHAIRDGTADEILLDVRMQIQLFWEHNLPSHFT